MIMGISGNMICIVKYQKKKPVIFFVAGITGDYQYFCFTYYNCYKRIYYRIVVEYKWKH